MEEGTKHNNLSFLLLVTSIIVIIFSIITFYINTKVSKLEKDVKNNTSKVNSILKIENKAESVHRYKRIVKYSQLYNIPKHYAYGIAYKETGYRGPLHFKYNSKLISSAGAVGAMQIMPGTGELMWKHSKDTISSRNFLLNNIDFNVQTSMKLCSTLYARTQNWQLTFGAYNTGKYIINDYAIDVVNFHPKKYWIKSLN